MNEPRARQSLPDILPEGQVVNRPWLFRKGFDRPAVDYYVRAKRLVSVGRGYYRRPGPPLRWQHMLFSLNEMGFDLHVGGFSALENAGVAHYLAIGHAVQFYGCDAPPSWCYDVVTGPELAHHGKGGFPCGEPAGIDHRLFGTWDWPLPESTPERALLEILLNVTDEHGFRAVDKLFESAVSLRPKVVQAVLEASQSVKAKRLFCWYAERYRHSWFGRINAKSIDLGRGKRQIVEQGRLNNRYQITVPAGMEMEEADEGNVF
ncbi:MAG: hypothetical protein EA383_17935 [Spirochaetaceae bacterium]|nr:MAG: hypothetical protein EA383_17935 [Spirochaetaceae bacterium]